VRRVPVLLGLALAAGCAAPPSPRVAPLAATPAAEPSPAPTPAPTPAPRFAALPSPTLDVSLAVDRSSAAFPAGDWIVESGERVERRRGPLLLAPVNGGLRVTDDGAASDWPSPVEIAPTNGPLVPWADAAYRGRLAVRATARGTVHVINRVGLEDYLKGVVPAEMGPRVYDEVEALKAQAVAARSYAVRHRGQFGAEGYDICATPRCQVYAGSSAESPLSTRAVEETAGEVLLWKGAVADALFTSTCGGRTENASDVMAGYTGIDAPYLASVTCFGETPITLESSAPGRKGTVTLLAARGRALAASLGGGEGPKIAQKAREAVRQRLGLAASGASRPHPLSVPAVYLEIASAAGFDTAVLSEESERMGLPDRWSEKARASFAALQRFQLGGGSALPTDRALKPEETAGIYSVLLSRLGDFEDVEGRLVTANETALTVKSAKGRSDYPFEEIFVLFEGGNEALSQVASHRFFPGDRVRVFVRAGKACGIVFPPQPAAGTYDRESVWEHWTRRFTAAELGAKLRERDGTRGAADPVGVAVTSRGVSGRARTVAVATAKGTLMLTGLEIRFALGLPESLFNVVAGTDEDDSRVFTFYGRGWGHGVGLCQTGAFGMALAGRTYREILAHYYPGATVGPTP
jgi:stage II sporulation protein D